MGVFSNNRPFIVPGALISSSYMSDIYDVFMGQTRESVVVSGSLVISGSSIITSGVTASLFGTSSWAVTASHALNARSASYAPKTDYLVISVSDENDSITTGSAKVTFRMPYAGTLQSVKSSLTLAPSGSDVIVDINNAGTSILSTKLSIDSTEKTSKTAATASVISNSVFNDDDEITIDIDQVGSIVAGKGLKVYFKTLIS